MNTEDNLVLVERPAAGVALVKLNRPQARNAQTIQSWLALEETLNQLATDAAVRSVVLAGEGNYFCAGGDLKTPPADGFRATASVARLEYAHRVIRKLRRYPLPVIAAVEGGAAGLGWSLALACDLVFTASEATFVAPFVARGVVPDGGMAWFLAQRIGRHRAADLLCSGRAVRGDEAVTWGLANRAVAAGTVVSAAVEYAARIPADYPHAMELTKRMLDAAEDMDMDSYLNLEQVTAVLCQSGPEAQEARRKFQMKNTGKDNKDRRD